MKRFKGKLIILEGIDGCGGETQSKKLDSYLKKKGVEHVMTGHPDYKTPLGKIINNHLYSKEDLNQEMQALIYFTEIFQKRDLIRRYLEEGKVVIADRYFTATLAYQGRDKKSLERLLRLEELFSLNKPDVSILIKISPETSLMRKNKEKNGNLDKFEKDVLFLKEVSMNYEKLAKKNVFCEWEVVDGEKTKDEVFEQIINIINNKLKI